jgi:predicted transcriptional regulator
MAITAQFLADYDAFIASTQGAERALKQLDAGGKGLGQTFDTVKGIAGQLAGAFGIAFSASALVGFAKDAIESAARLGDLAAATGVTTDSLQRLGSVAAGFGVNIEEIARAVGTLSTRLASGDASAVGAVQSLGLNVGRLIASGPTEAFLDIAEAAGRVEDPMQKLALGSALFGDKLAKVLIPALVDLRTKMQEVPQDAIISKETIDKANAFEAAVKRGITRLEAWTATAFGAVFSYEHLGVSAAQTAAAVDEHTKGLKNNQEAVAPVITTADLLANRLKALRTEALEPLTKAQQATAGELMMYGVSQKEIAQLLGVSESALRLFTEADKASAEEMKRAAVEAEKFADIIAGLGRDALAKSQKEFDEWSARLTITTDRVTAAILRESEAQTVLNASHGLNALGATKVTSAQETLRLSLEALHRTKEGNIAQTAQEQVLTDAYTKALYDEAVALDKLNGVTAQLPPTIDKIVPAFNGATQAAGVFMQQLTMLVTDPAIQGFFGTNVQGAVAQTLFGGGQNGLTPEMAAAIAAGLFINTAGVGSVPLRGTGGPGVVGQSYIVGDTGPELYTPGASGFFTPGSQGGGVTTNVTIYVNGTAADVARQVADEILRRVKQGKQLGSA